MTIKYLGDRCFTGTEEERKNYMPTFEQPKGYKDRLLFWAVDSNIRWKWNGKKWYKIRKRKKKN